MADRETIIAAQNAWRDAVNAHNDEAAKYVAVWWGDKPFAEPQPWSREALAELTRLHEAEGAALAALRDVLDEA